MSKVIRLAAAEWADLLAGGARGSLLLDEESRGVEATVAAMVQAPVRATLLATAGDTGAATRLMLSGDQVLLVTEPVSPREGQIVASGEVQLTFVDAAGLWPAIAAVLPGLEALRAPAVAGSGGTEIAGSPESIEALLQGEEANLQVRVEAWPDAESASRVWGRLWSVVDGRLLDVRSSGGRLRLRERPPGAVAAELEWALAGALAETQRPVGDH